MQRRIFSPPSLPWAALALFLGVAGCSSDTSADSSEARGGGAGTAQSSGAGTAGMQNAGGASSGGAGTSAGNAAAGAGVSGSTAGMGAAGLAAMSGAAGSMAGMPQAAGMAGTGEAGATGGTAGAGDGGMAGSATGGAGGSSAGVAGDSGMSGAAGMGSDLHGGASGGFICDPNATYGDPLAGMGEVVTISPPTMGDVTYFAFIEGPVWVGSLGTLFFSDNASSPEERIWKLVPPSTTPEVFMESSGSNGLAIDNDDQLILADQRNQRIVRVDNSSAMVTDTLVPSGGFTPNDLVVRSDGNIYFTDPNSAGRGFYRVSPQGELSSAMTEVNSPNGIVLSPDENTLYVGDVQNRTITSFSLSADGSVDTASQAVFGTTMANTLDGMAVDCAGNVYGSTAEGVEVFSSSGDYIGTVPTGESSNATFGGDARTTLYVTSRAVLKAVTLAVPGLPD